MHFLTMAYPEINAAKFFALIIQEVWTYVLEIWKTQNKDQTLATTKKLPICGLIAIAAKDCLSQPAQDCIFNLTKEELILKPKPYTQAWIHNSTNYIQNELKIQTKQQNDSTPKTSSIP